MAAPWVVWWLTVAGVVGLPLFGFMTYVRKAHVPSLREAAVWSTAHVEIDLSRRE